MKSKKSRRLTLEFKALFLAALIAWGPLGRHAEASDSQAHQPAAKPSPAAQQHKATTETQQQTDPSKQLSMADASPQASPASRQAQSDSTNRQKKNLKICSFNIKFLGLYNVRNNFALVDTVSKAGCEVLVVQELVSPPDLNEFEGHNYPHRMADPITQLKSWIYPEPDRKGRIQPLVASPNTHDFFKEMHKAGFTDFLISDGKTGTSKDVGMQQGMSSSTEWFVTFYKPESVQPAPQLPNGYLSNFGISDPKLWPAARRGHPDWDRVPYATGFQTTNGAFDFVLISVHLRPGPGGKHERRRHQEIHAIYNWIEKQKTVSKERDYIVLGDMNIESGKELASIFTNTPYISLNTEAKKMTNTLVQKPKPFDHVMLNPQFTTSNEVAPLDNFEVMDLLELMRPYWQTRKRSDGTLYHVDALGRPLPYIGERSKYNMAAHNRFQMYYSDHQPVSFMATIPDRDDD